MDETAIIGYIKDTFGADVFVKDGDSYIFYDPGRGLPVDRMFPFATLVTDDKHDSASNLNRPGVFRLNIGVSKQTFASLFSDADGGHDFTALDRIMPHPVYGKMYWVCVLSPSAETFQQAVRPLLAEAYEIATKKYAAKARPAEGSAQGGA